MVQLAGGNPALYGYVGNPNMGIDPLGLYDPYDFQFTQDSISDVFEKGPLKGTSIFDAIDFAIEHGKLPSGLQLNFIRINTGKGEVWATLNNRRLFVAQQADLDKVKATDIGDKGLNQFNKLTNGGKVLPLGQQPDVNKKKTRC